MKRSVVLLRRQGCKILAFIFRMSICIQTSVNLRPLILFITSRTKFLMTNHTFYNLSIKCIIYLYIFYTAHELIAFFITIFVNDSLELLSFCFLISFRWTFFITFYILYVCMFCAFIVFCFVVALNTLSFYFELQFHTYAD